MISTTLITVPGTPRVLASSRISDDAGHIRAVDVRDHSTTILFPDPTSRVAPDAETYASCPGSPTAGFQPLPENGIAVTNFSLPSGELWEWRPADGWSEVPGSEMSGPNNVTSSRDGDWLCVGGWGEEALVRVSRGRQPIERGSVDVGFHIDNVRWAPDGSLLVAGQAGPSVAAIGGCLNGGDPGGRRDLGRGIGGGDRIARFPVE